MDLVQVTKWELISLLGLAQSLWLLVYMVLRSGRISNASVALACFSCLALAFLADFGSRYLSEIKAYPLGQDFIWYSLPFFSVLLCIQIAKIHGMPERRFFLGILFLPLLAAMGWILGSLSEECGFTSICDVNSRRQMLGIAGILSGSLCLLGLWVARRNMSDLLTEKSYRSDRYWLILSLIIINCAQLCLTLSHISGVTGLQEYLMIRDVLGCGLVYLASTSLFRIYPQTVKVAPKNNSQLNAEETGLINKIEDLVTLQKVYQEPGYSRADLARELKTSEAVVTKLVNVYFGKSVPQLINEKRIDDARRLLEQTDAAVSVVAEQVGFNSLPSFNRVFKEIAGVSPTEYRAQKQRTPVRKV